MPASDTLWRGDRSRRLRRRPAPHHPHRQGMEAGRRNNEQETVLAQEVLKATHRCEGSHWGKLKTAESSEPSRSRKACFGPARSSRRNQPADSTPPVSWCRAASRSGDTPDLRRGPVTHPGQRSLTAGSSSRPLGKTFRILETRALGRSPAMPAPYRGITNRSVGKGRDQHDGTTGSTPRSTRRARRSGPGELRPAAPPGPRDPRPEVRVRGVHGHRPPTRRRRLLLDIRPLCWWSARMPPAGRDPGRGCTFVSRRAGSPPRAAPPVGSSVTGGHPALPPTRAPPGQGPIRPGLVGEHDRPQR
jgi:hypothetical protein